MLPESYEEGGDWAGLSTLLGFLASLFVKLTFEKHGHEHSVCAIECYDAEHMNEDHERIYHHSAGLAAPSTSSPLSWIHDDTDDF